jgi:site-specific DNA-adenine methylase
VYIQKATGIMMQKKEKVKPVIGRVGGKARLAPWIGSFIKEHNFSIFCEPFCGSAATYFYLLNEGIPEQVKARGRHFRAVLNDADREIMNLYKTVRDYPELLAYSVYFTPYSRAEHKDSQSRGSGDRLEDARQYLTDGWQSFKGMAGDSWGIRKGGLKYDGGMPDDSSKDAFVNTLPSRILTAAPHLGESEAINPYACLNAVGRQFVEPDVDFRVEWVRRYLTYNWQERRGRHLDDPDHSYWAIEQGDDKDVRRFETIPSRILTASPHLQENLNDLKKVYLECDDAIKVIERWATPETLFYLDPPYIDCEKYYAHNAKQSKDDTLEMHYRLAKTLNEVECAGAIVSYYPNDLLDELYPEENWDRHYKETVASSAGIPRNSKTKTRPKRTELLLIRKQQKAITFNVSGQLKLF